MSLNPSPPSIWALTLLSMLSTIAILAQPHPYGFERLQNEQIGIANTEVHDILKDQFGFMWFATTTGLIRYDGHEMKIFQENPLDTSMSFLADLRGFQNLGGLNHTAKPR